MNSQKQLLMKLLKGIETGDPEAAAVVNESKYIQHNPRTGEGSPGLADLFARLAKTNPRVTFFRVFEDGDFAFAHNEYDFNGVEVAFEVFGFEDSQAVEHWDNIQLIQPTNPSGRTMLDGETEITDLDKTEYNREIAREFVERVLIGRDFEAMASYLATDLIQHDPDIADGLASLRAALEKEQNGGPKIKHETLHRVLAEGNFALCMIEGHRDGQHAGLYSLFRLADGRIVEHWTTCTPIPPRHEWRKDNGKF